MEPRLNEVGPLRHDQGNSAVGTSAEAVAVAASSAVAEYAEGWSWRPLRQTSRDYDEAFAGNELEAVAYPAG